MDEQAAAQVRRLIDTVERLRAPGGCPWDRAQTHRTLAPFLEEETHETVAAIESGDDPGLQEELGDVLVQVAMHAAVAAERGAFGIGDVAAAADAKMVRRHPHVFAGAQVADAAAVLDNWERLKAAERGDRLSLLDGVPATLPALSRALAVQRRPARVGLDPTPSAAAARAALAAVLGRFDGDAAVRPSAPDRAASEALVGELLFAAVALARHLQVDPEGALRHRVEAHRDRVVRAEGRLRAAGRVPTQASPQEWRSAWAPDVPGVDRGGAGDRPPPPGRPG